MQDAKDHGSFVEFVRAWRYFIAALALCLVVALFYLEEDWRGHWAWERYQRQLSSRGESILATTFVPPRVPDDKNFAMTPFLAPLFDFVPGSQKWAGGDPIKSANAFAPRYDAASGHLKAATTNVFNSWIKPSVDLSNWYGAFLKNDTNGVIPKPSTKDNFTAQESALGVLAGLSECNDVLEELQTASRLPYSRFNLRYEQDDPAEILLPHLAVLKHLTQVLQLRASARLALGQTDAALDDLKLMLFLARACRTEPFLISHLVRMAQFYLALQPLSEGLGKWSEPQLRQLQEILAQFDFCADAKRSLAAERAWGGAIIDFIARSADKNNVMGGMSGQSQIGLAGVMITAAPGGWLDLEKLHYSRIFEREILPLIDPATRVIRPEAVRQAGAQLKDLTSDSWPASYVRHRFFCKLLLPNLTSFVRKTAFGQTAVDFATIACALERYRLAQGHYPESLDALSPEFIPRLPRDIINGQALKYRLKSADHYLLYSVGWNQTDDGGAVGVFRAGEDFAAEEGDWVWQLP